MKNQKQEYKLPEDEEYEDEEYENQDMEDEDDEEEQEDQVAETVFNNQNNYQQEENSQGFTPGSASQNGYGNVQVNSNFQFPGAAQNRMQANGQQVNPQGRMRPQSAKTGDDQQLRFQQQIYQQQQNSNILQNPAWVGGMQQNYMNDPSQVSYAQANQMAGYTAPYVQGGFYQAIPQGGTAQNNGKKRPTTASRRGNGLLQFGTQKKSFGSKNPSTLDLEISKLRPRLVNQDRERLFDDAMKQKMAANYLKDENTKLKTKLHIMENEMSKKEKLIDDLLMQQDSYQVGVPVQGLKSSKIKLEGHLAMNLKRKIKELQQIIVQKHEEIEGMKRNIKSTKFTEIEIESKMYMDECTRLRHQLEEVIKSKDTFADPEELKMIESKFSQQEALINQLRNENSELANAYSKKEDENRQLREMFTDLEKKSKKALQNSKEAVKVKKQLKASEKEAKKLSAELQHQKALNDDFKAKIEEMVKKGPLQNNINNNNYSSGMRPSTAQVSTDGDKKLRQEVQDKTQKIHELNNVVQQLQTKLQDKINDLSKEAFEKNKFKKLYEEYQDQVVQLQAQIEDGDFKQKAQPRKLVNQKEEIQRSQPIKDQSYSSDDSDKVKNKAAPGVMKARVEKKIIEDVALEIRFKVQSKGFYSNQIQDFFFKPYNPDQDVSVKSLQDIFETNGIIEKKSLSLARYIIEPKTGAQVSYSDDNKLPQKDISKILTDLIGHYQLYNDANQIKKLNEQAAKTFAKCKETLKDTLQLEDYNDDETVPLSAFKEAFSTLDLKVSDELYDYLIYSIYLKSQSIEKMKYQVLLDIIEGKVIQGQLSVGSNDGSRKRPESSSPQKIKARNQDKFPPSQSNKAKAGQQQPIDDEDEDDNYEDEFEKLVQEKDDEDDDNKKYLQNSDDEDDSGKKGAGMDDEDDDQNYIDDEDMLDVAERCFVKIAEAIIKKGHSVRQAFANFIIKEEIETEDGDAQVIELLSPIGFLEGLKELGIDDLEEVEVACLMRVLTKTELENAILLRELIVIMENFGILDDEGGAEDLAEHEIEQESAQMQDEKPDDGKKKKKKKKGGASAKAMDLSLLDEKSIKIMAKLMLALMELNVSLYDFFDGVVYEQLVKTKTKQNSIEIMNAKDFFDYLNKRGVRKSNKEHENLSKFLQLDANYPNLLMIKKIAKTLDEMAKNEELMQGILAAAEQDLGGNDGGDDEDMYNSNNNNIMGSGEIQQNPQQRLITIGEDGEEDRHFDTNKDNSKNGVVAGGATIKTNQSIPNKKSIPQQVDDDDDDNEYDQDPQQFAYIGFFIEFEQAAVDDDYEENDDDDYEI